MKILIVASIFFTISAFVSVSAHAYDLEKLSTKTGKVYRDVQIIDADEHGLLFRHSKGIAKESFPQLSNNIRDMFEPVAEVPAATKIDLSSEPTSQMTEKGAKTAAPQVYIPDMTLTMLIRRPVNQYPNWYHNWHPNPQNWPSHWHKFHSAHYLTNPVYRARATENFLQATGLLPRPCGGIFHHSAGANSIRFW